MSLLLESENRQVSLSIGSTSVPLAAVVYTGFGVRAARVIWSARLVVLLPLSNAEFLLAVQVKRADSGVVTGNYFPRLMAIGQEFTVGGSGLFDLNPGDVVQVLGRTLVAVDLAFAARGFLVFVD